MLEGIRTLEALGEMYFGERGDEIDMVEAAPGVFVPRPRRVAPRWLTDLREQVAQGENVRAQFRELLRSAEQRGRSRVG